MPWSPKTFQSNPSSAGYSPKSFQSDSTQAVESDKPQSKQLYEENEVGPLHAIGVGAGQGMSFGHMDEAASALDSMAGGALKIDSNGVHWQPEELDYQHAADRNRQLDSRLQSEYPKLYGASRLAGSVVGTGKLAALSKIGKIGAAAKGVGGVLARVGGAMGLGGLIGAAEGEGNATTPLADSRTIDAAEHGGVLGMATGAAGQLLLGEPIRAGANAISGRIAASDRQLGQAADDAIASARGKAGKQAQEAVGGLENLQNARNIAKDMPSDAVQVGPRPPPMGIPPNARIGDPLYHVQGMNPEAAKAFLVSKMRMMPDAADDFLQNEAAPYLAKGAAAAAGPPAGVATAVMRGQGRNVMNDLLQRRVGNAENAINDFVHNPVQVPGRDTALASAREAANVAAGAEAKGGARDLVVGAGAKALGMPFLGAFNAQQGVRRLVRAAFSAPAVLDRLRSIPGAGRAIGNAAGRGSVALESTLFALSRDPHVASQLQSIDADISTKDEE